MVDKYKIELTFLRNVLATNPCDPNIMDTHILDRQRKLILEKSDVNTQVNKYLNQLQISKEKGEQEIQKIIDRLETLIGYELSEEARQDAIAGKLLSLKETLQEIDIKGTQVFFWDKSVDRPCIGNHMIYGFLKAAAEAIGRTLPKKMGTMMNSTAYTQSIINQHCRCEETFITFDKSIMKNEKGEPQYLQRSLRAMTAKGPRISLAKSEQVEAGAKISFTLKVMNNSPLTEDVLKQLFSYGEFCGIGQWRNAGWGTFSFSLVKV